METDPDPARIIHILFRMIKKTFTDMTACHDETYSHQFYAVHIIGQAGR